MRYYEQLFDKYKEATMKAEKPMPALGKKVLDSILRLYSAELDDQYWAYAAKYVDDGDGKNPEALLTFTVTYLDQKFFEKDKKFEQARKDGIV